MRFKVKEEEIKRRFINVDLAYIELILLVFWRRKVNESPRMWKPMGKFEWVPHFAKKGIGLSCAGSNCLIL